MEEDLIRNARKGDKIAFSSLIEHYEKDMYIIAKSKLNCLQDIEDAIQETILEMYSDIWMLRNPNKFRSWMAKILINNCYDIIKENKKYDIGIDKFNLDDIQDENNESYDSNNDFFSLISFLDNDDQTLLILKYFQGYSSVEISKILKMKESTVRMRLLRIKAKIKDELGDEEIG